MKVQQKGVDGVRDFMISLGKLKTLIQRDGKKKRKVTSGCWMVLDNAKKWFRQPQFLEDPLTCESLLVAGLVYSQSGQFVPYLQMDHRGSVQVSERSLVSGVWSELPISNFG